MKFFIALLFLCATITLGAPDDDSNKPNGPPFFLIDSTDQLCLAGEEFKRCSIDTLFYVVGSPGKFLKVKQLGHNDTIRCESADIFFLVESLTIFKTRGSETKQNYNQATIKFENAWRMERKTRRKMERALL